ncbi:hypothetical protein N7456_009137 [Penicillium angulare]|uniref:NAD(P)-binding protein n=1 Tax=Penicillium angulare TaxID=116970 RepID=A0A9W9F481_9EURO|nr:hypothetical protein N7456_009137 [Penicillium angulare]
MSPTLGQLNAQQCRTFVPTLHTTPYPAIDPSLVNLPSPYVVCILGGHGAAGGAARTLSALDETANEVRSINPATKVVVAQCNIALDDDVKSLVGTVNSEFEGRLDAVVANAGYSGPLIADVVLEKPSDIQTSFDVNTVGPFLVAHYLLPLLLATESGAKSFITINSMGAPTVTGPSGHASYCVSKAAQARLIEMINEQYGGQGLFSASVHPGGMRSGFVKDLPEEILKLLNDSPDLVGAFCVWLSKPDAPQTQRDVLKGRFLSCKWDVSELEARFDEIKEKDLLKFRIAVE